MSIASLGGAVTLQCLSLRSSYTSRTAPFSGSLPGCLPISLRPFSPAPIVTRRHCLAPLFQAQVEISVALSVQIVPLGILARSVFQPLDARWWSPTNQAPWDAAALPATLINSWPGDRYGGSMLEISRIRALSPTTPRSRLGAPAPTQPLYRSAPTARGNISYGTKRHQPYPSPAPA